MAVSRGLYCYCFWRIYQSIASEMVQAEKQHHLKRLDKKKQREIIANYFVSESEPLLKNKSKIQCQIDANKVRTVQFLVMDLMEQRNVMNGWMQLLIITYADSHALR